MNTKRSTLAYGAEDGEGLTPHDGVSSTLGGAPDTGRMKAAPAAQVLFQTDSPAEPFDATPFPDPDKADDRIRAVRDALPNAASLHRLADNLKALADPSRLTILNALAVTEMRVGELAEAVSMSQSAVSHQLRVLRAAHLVAVRREGKNAWYKLADPNLVCLIAPPRR